MEENKQDCNPFTATGQDAIMDDKLKLLEITEAINELDSKLTDLEIALNLSR